MVEGNLDRKAEKLPAEIIENYLRYGDTKVGGEYQQLMEEAANTYVDKIFVVVFILHNRYAPLSGRSH